MSPTVLPERKPPDDPWRNPWVLGWIALIVVVLLVNAAMIMLAYVTSPGLVVKDHYERGEAYASTAAERARQRDLGWSLALAGEPGLRRAAPLRLSLKDGSGAPLLAEAAVLHAYRPSDARADFHAVFVPLAPGEYSADVAFPLPGVWDLVIEVRAAGSRLEEARRIDVPSR